MPDVMTTVQRSALMSRIRGRGNQSTEILLMGLFRAGKLTGWRRHVKIKGRPDFVFFREKVAVFVDGCFWHGCPQHFQSPQSRADFWREKIGGNMRRDRLVRAALRRDGWLVIRVWEHSLRSKTALRTFKRIERVILSRRRDVTEPDLDR